MLHRITRCPKSAAASGCGLPSAQRMRCLTSLLLSTDTAAAAAADSALRGCEPDLGQDDWPSLGLMSTIWNRRCSKTAVNLCCNLTHCCYHPAFSIAIKNWPSEVATLIFVNMTDQMSTIWNHRRSEIPLILCCNVTHRCYHTAFCWYWYLNRAS